MHDRPARNLGKANLNDPLTNTSPLDRNLYRDRQQSVSIIIPCFNESEGVPALADKLLPVLNTLALTRQIELILVDDGSIDDTFAKLETYFGSLAQIVRHQENSGIWAAIQTGFGRAKGKIVCCLDSDCTYHPQQLFALLDLMSAEVDIVTASPYHPKGSVQNVPGWRLFLSKGLSKLYGLVLPQKLYTYTSMFRAYRREVLESVPTSNPGFLGLVEILAEGMLRGCKVVEYPTQLSNRRFGQSKLRVMRVIFHHLGYLKKLIIRRLHKKTIHRKMSYSLQSK